ncbi:helix-turn-helix domain-containing protein [Vagococcus fluvialis]|uniref:helix-turn-helix domain-containing protein n=1 Tax=Vagococcus fluvialis TaxID=2738 RepID=UPI0022E09AF6|nr:AraC family transcriptional regulator [Vagococcus fluvialis]
MFKKKFFLRTFLTFFFIVFIYTFLVVVTIVSNQSKTVEKERDVINKQFIEEQSNLIDNRLETILTYINLLTQKESFKNYIVEEEENFTVYSELYDDVVSNLFSTAQLGFSVGVFKNLNDYIVSSEGYYEFNDYMEHLNLERNIFSIKNMLQNKTDNKFEYIENEKSSVLIMKQNLEYLNQNVYFFISFDNKSILPENLPTNAYFSFGNEDQLLFEKGSKPKLNESLHSYESDSESIKEYIIGDNSLYTKQSSVLSEVSYHYFISKTIIPFSSNYLNRTVLFWIFVLLIVGSAASYLLAKTMYKPIASMMKSLSGSDQKDELQFVRDSVRTISEVNQNLELQFNQSLDYLQEQLLKDVAYRVMVDEKEIEKKIEQLKLNELLEGGTATVVSLDGLSEVQSNLSEVNVLTLRKVILSNHSLNDKHKMYSFFAINYNSFCVFFYEKDPLKVEVEIKELIQLLELEKNIDISFSMAKPISNYKDLPLSFNEALALSEQKYSFTDSSIISMESNQIKREDYDFSFESEQIFLQMLKSKNADGAMEFIAEIIIKNFSKKMSDQSLIGFKHVLLNTIKRVLNSYNKSFVEFSRINSYLFEKINLNDIKVLEDSFIMIFSNLILSLEIMEERDNKNTSDRIMEYIHDNFQRDLSLSDISCALNLSESYVSKVVSETTKTTFKNYTNSLKVVKGKELLSTKQYQVQEVSKMVGCNNVNTFIRIFKQFEGCSPGKYIKELRQ